MRTVGAASGGCAVICTAIGALAIVADYRFGLLHWLAELRGAPHVERRP